MTEVLLAVIGVALLLYAVLGGAERPCRCRNRLRACALETVGVDKVRPRGNQVTGLRLARNAQHNNKRGAFPMENAPLLLTGSDRS